MGDLQGTILTYMVSLFGYSFIGSNYTTEACAYTYMYTMRMDTHLHISLAPHHHTISHCYLVKTCRLVSFFFLSPCLPVLEP